MANFLVACDKCKGSLSAFEVCSLAKSVLQQRFPGSQIVEVPLTDGGEGFTDILTCGATGLFHPIKVKDSIGNQKQAKIGLCEIAKLPASVTQALELPSSGKLAIVEMAQSAGLADLTSDQRNPWQTSTYGVGQMLLEAARLGVDAILLGIGGSSTNDIGLGALHALGLSIKNEKQEEIPFPSPSTWTNIRELGPESLSDLPPIRIACDVENQLLGEFGATAQYGLQKGLPKSEIGLFESEIKDLLNLLKPKEPKTFDLAKANGSGAAGGMGFGLSLFYEVSLVQGFQLISSWFEIEKKIKKADFVITAEGRFDQTSMDGKGPYQIVKVAQQNSTQSLVIAGSVDDKVAVQLSKNFPDCSFISFGRSDWTMEKNLSCARENFLSTLLKYPFSDLI